MIALEVFFWLCVALIVYTHLGYALLLAGLARLPRRVRTVAPLADDALPTVTVIVFVRPWSALMNLTAWVPGLTET